MAVGVAASSVALTSDPSSRPTRPVDPATAKAAGDAVHGLRPDWFRGLDRHPAATVRVKRSLVRHGRGGRVALTVTVDDIPPVPLAAYRAAAASLATTDPSCHLPWPLLAGVGGIESDHARSGGSTRPGWNGIADPAILGPLLDGSGGFAAVRDTDRGRLDGNSHWDRAVGPMQFLPSSWVGSAADGDSDGVRNPEDMYDAALGAGIYLCRSGVDLSTPRGLAAAVFSYNHSVDYVQAVLLLTARYARKSPAALGIVPRPPKGPGAPVAAAVPATTGTRRVTRPTTFARPAVQTHAAPAASSAGAPGGTVTATDPATGAGTTAAGQTSPTAGSVTTTSGTAAQPSSASAVVSTGVAPTTVAPTTASATPTGSACPAPTPTGSASPSPTPSPTLSPSLSPTPSPCR